MTLAPKWRASLHCFRTCIARQPKALETQQFWARFGLAGGSISCRERKIGSAARALRFVSIQVRLSHYHDYFKLMVQKFWAELHREARTAALLVSECAETSTAECKEGQLAAITTLVVGNIYVTTQIRMGEHRPTQKNRGRPPSSRWALSCSFHCTIWNTRERTRARAIAVWTSPRGSPGGRALTEQYRAYGSSSS